MKLRNNDIGLLFSALLHLLLIAMFIVQAPDLFNQKTKITQKITKFDVVSIKDFNNLLPKKSEVQNVKLQMKGSNSNAKKTTNKKSLAKPKEVNKTPPKQAPGLTKKEQIRPKTKVPEDTAITTRKKPKNIAKDDSAKKTKQPKEVKRSKPRPKKVAKKAVDPMESLLKDLEASTETNKKSNNALKDSSSSPNHKKVFSKGLPTQFYDEFSPLSITEQSLIKGQIEKSWNPPQGLTNFQQSIISLKIKISPQGVIKDAKIIANHCPGMSAQECEKLINSIIRAVTKASPLRGLMPSRHENWAEMQVNFAPSF